MSDFPIETSCWNKLALMLLSAAGYALLNHLTYGYRLPGAFEVIAVRPQIVLPLLGGFLLGPVHGFFIGFTGNLFGDWLCGLGFRFWTFSVGNGIMGALPGVLYVAGVRRVETVVHFMLVLLSVTLGNVLGMGLGVVGYNQLTGDAMDALTWGFFQPIIVSNVLLGFILIPPVLYAMKRLVASFDVRLGLSLFYLLIGIILLLLYFLGITDYHLLNTKLGEILTAEARREFLAAILMNDFQIGGSIGIGVIIAGVAMTLLLLQYLLKPVRELIRAAQLLKDGQLERIDLSDLKGKSDEFGKLAQVFDDAVAQVQKREESLRDVIVKLRVEINQEQEARQVREITETDYFRSLQSRAHVLRKRKEKS